MARAPMRVDPETDRCELCGGRTGPAAGERIAHLKAEHPGYARGLLLRVVAPGLFLISVLVLAAVRAPGWTYAVALAASFGLLFFGKQRSRVERTKAGVRATLPARRILREGGLAFLLVVPAVALLVAFLGRG